MVNHEQECAKDFVESCNTLCAYPRKSKYAFTAQANIAGARSILLNAEL